ncbi:V-type ATP synthase subunit A [Acholeplasma sp. OttesenSCG-928-E16]|nr:V-type ATP synthase subunit A [Acholeplasma sp. OttesenSCG-928-E16]
MSKNVVYSINGPVVTVKNSKDFQMLEMVYVGNDRLLGEVIAISNDKTVIQVYESTTMLMPGEEVIGTNNPIALKLGPGLLSNIFDGILRPLKTMAKDSQYIKKGTNIESLDLEALFDVKILCKVDDKIKMGDIYATTKEINKEHRIMMPYLHGTITWVAKDGKYRVDDTIAKVKLSDGSEVPLTLCQKWPIKTPRIVKERLTNSIPLITGQRVLDTLFPIAKGGTAAIPGGFGAGKTMLQHQLAKWCDADIIVYIGCGERGNEMTQVLEEFSELIDPKTNRPLMERVVLIANTSNMPVAAREASIYTGVTIAEYYRDMGYNVALMADSTSRWAEALREISGRLEEMPAEEGFPAYLPSRLSQFYERAGYMKNLNGTEGSVTIIGAVSPQGADFSEPVTQNTKRFVRAFWGLDKDLAYKRHYPAVNWNLSYSEYIADLAKYYEKKVDPLFLQDRQRLVTLLANENKLLEIVKLIGGDVLPDDQKLIIKIGEVIREGFLQQNAFHKEDTFVPIDKQLKMMEVILYLYDRSREVIIEGKAFSLILKTGIFEKLIQIKYEVKNDELGKFKDYFEEIDKVIEGIR